jgi:hypothetical protein
MDYWLKREYLNRAIFGGIIDADEHTQKAREIEDGFISGYEKLLESGADIEKFAKYSKACAEKEEEFINSYSDIIEKMKNQTIKLKGLWGEKTKRLGI